MQTSTTLLRDFNQTRISHRLRSAARFAVVMHDKETLEQLLKTFKRELLKYQRGV